MGTERYRVREREGKRDRWVERQGRETGGDRQRQRERQGSERERQVERKSERDRWGERQGERETGRRERDKGEGERAREC